MRYLRVGILMAFIWGVFGSYPAMATLENSKTYKKYFETSAKCTTCHVDKTPKKEDGKHELNEYGKKVLAAMEELKKDSADEEVFKKVGKNEAEEE